MALKALKKRAGFMETTLGKVVFGLILLIVLIGLVMLFTGTLQGVWKKFVSAFRFG